MTDLRLVFTLVLVLAGGFLLYLLAPILTPFLAGALLAYVSNPLVGALQRLSLPRALAVVIVFIAIFLGVTVLAAILLPLVQQKVAEFVTRVPDYVAWLQQRLLPRLQTVLGELAPLDAASLTKTVTAHWQEIGAWLQNALAGITRSGLGVVMWLLNLVLVPVVTFYLLLDWDRLLAAARDVLPASAAPRLVRLARESDAVLASFLRGQLSVMAVLAGVYSTGLWLVGLDLALPIGLFAGLVSFVPYLGFITGLVSAGVAAYVQFQQPAMLLGVAAVFVAGQLLEGLVLTPRLVGSRIGLHPVAVIFAVMAGGQLFGFLGVLLALPAAAVLKVWLAHLPELYSVSPPRRRRSSRNRGVPAARPR